jgi:hypothetical protein
MWSWRSTCRFTKIRNREVYELLRQIFEPRLNGDEIPNDWKIGHISAIHKKGKKDEYENYRGIAVLNIFSRLYGTIIKYFWNMNFPR